MTAAEPDIARASDRSFVSPAPSAPRFRWRLNDFARAAQPLLTCIKSLSFSQYGEDLLLAVSLFPGKRGTYVDVGAYHPWKGSNTYKLYLKGWSGVTIEPNPEAAESFRRIRPRDIHVNAGVSATPSTLKYYEFEDRKLNTFSDEQANIYAKEGNKVLREQMVACKPLQDIVNESLDGRDIDLLSVDCEGFDLIALKSLDFTRRRPAAILVEDFEALARFAVNAPSDIAKFLAGQGYVPVGQAMFSTLYVDLTLLRKRSVGAFDFGKSQLPNYAQIKYATLQDNLA